MAVREPVPARAREASATRDTGIDRAKGLLIFLVVFGHLVSSTQFARLGEAFQWYRHINLAIYSFHMPAFFYLSGLISFNSLLRARSTPGRFILKRADRLLIPFFAMGVVILLGKTLALGALGQGALGGHVQNSFAAGLMDLFWTTGKSPSRAIWYLFCYFGFLCVSLPFVRSRMALNLLLAVSLGLYFVDLPAILYLNKFGANFWFFLLGLASASHFDFEKRLAPMTLIALVVGVIGLFAVSQWKEHIQLSILVCGTLSGPLIINLCRGMDERAFLFLGRNTMPIYLFNTIVIGVVSAVGLGLLRLAPNVWSLLLLLVAFPCALVAPILVKAIVRRYAPTVAGYMS